MRLEHVSIELRTKREALRIRVPLFDAWPTFEVFAFGEYDFPVIQWGAVRSVIDCGAHVGSFTLWASLKSSCQIIAVEPNPHAYGLLKHNIARLGPRVSIVNSAVAATRGEQLMYDRGFPGLASLVNRSGGQGFKVGTVTLEDIMNDGGLEFVDLLKMDVEGSEQEVFRGIATDTLRRIKIVIVECHPHLGTNWEMISGKLADAGMNVTGEPRLVVAWRDTP